MRPEIRTTAIKANFSGFPHPNLTQLERPCLTRPFNLTDGHAHFSCSAQQQAIIHDLPALFFQASRESQPFLERSFLETFYGFARQTMDHARLRYLLSPSASLSLEIVANYLRLNQHTLALIEPCFDNLPDIFKRHGIPLRPIPESALAGEVDLDYIAALDTSAIALVTPNNPTGFSVSQNGLSRLAEHCARHGKLLVVDASFRFFGADLEWDQYRCLTHSGVDFVLIEDTGKTWPTQEMKISVLATTPALYTTLERIHTDFLLHVSPFVLLLLQRFVEESTRSSLGHLRSLLATNRHSFQEEGLTPYLRPRERPSMSVSWLETPSGMRSTDLTHYLAGHDLHVLPGRQFYWHNGVEGEGFIRMALARDSSVFSQATARLGAAVRAMAEAWPSCAVVPTAAT